MVGDRGALHAGHDLRSARIATSTVSTRDRKIATALALPDDDPPRVVTEGGQGREVDHAGLRWRCRDPVADQCDHVARAGIQLRVDTWRTGEFSGSQTMPSGISVTTSGSVTGAGQRRSPSAARRRRHRLVWRWRLSSGRPRRVRWPARFGSPSCSRPRSSSSPPARQQGVTGVGHHRGGRVTPGRSARLPVHAPISCSCAVDLVGGVATQRGTRLGGAQRGPGDPRASRPSRRSTG